MSKCVMLSDANAMSGPSSSVCLKCRSNRYNLYCFDCELIFSACGCKNEHGDKGHKTNTPKVHCISCNKDIFEALVVEGEAPNIWEYPHSAVVFKDVGNFGSSVYDSYIDGKHVSVAVCDECLTAKRMLLKVTEDSRDVS